jgi:membrane protein insertase Oxa1/YidC/SpoIIIJ
MVKSLFANILYRPLLNILVLIYDLMPVYKDMGMALIIFVLIIEILLSPLRKGVAASESEQEKLMRELKEAEKKYRDDVLKFKREKEQIFKKYRKTINLRGLDLLVEGIYFVTFWWIFAKGLPQQQWDLLYSWVPHPPEPVNLTFLNLFDLTVVNSRLNLISAVGLFIILFLKNWWKPKKATREDYLILFWGPFAAYFISSQLPAGQEFFFTVTESIYFLRLVYQQIKKIGRKLGFGELPVTGKDFADTAWKQIRGS